MLPKLARQMVVAALALAGVGGLYFGYRAWVGWPATPMTVSQANRLFDNGLESGQTISQVEAWLASQGIPPTRTAPPWAVSYDVLRRPEGGPFKDSWMDGRGGQTVAECAGLGVDDVYTVIRVSYPEADRFPLAVITITVYLFFDGQARLMRHWVDEFHLMP